MTNPDVSLEAYAREANEAHNEAQESFRSGTEHARRAGRALIKAKAQVAHGGWSRWLADNFDGSERTAQLYMRLARHWTLLDDENRNDVAEMALRDAAKHFAEPRTFHVRHQVIESAPIRISIRREDVVPAYPHLQVSSTPGGEHGCVRPASIPAMPAPALAVRTVARAARTSVEDCGIAGQLTKLREAVAMIEPEEFAVRLQAETHLTAGELEELGAWIAAVASALDSRVAS